MSDVKLFPIQKEILRSRDNMGRCFYVDFPTQIPWSHAELAYQEYSRQYGMRQSLERMAERGGFGANEFVMHFYRQPDSKVTWDNIEYWREKYKTEAKEGRFYR